MAIVAFGRKQGRHNPGSRVLQEVVKGPGDTLCRILMGGCKDVSSDLRGIEVETEFKI